MKAVTKVTKALDLDVMSVLLFIRETASE